MQWLNEPASWQRSGEVLRVNVDPGTDFWRATGYGYIHDNGHVYGEVLPGDLDVSVRVRGSFASQYDQAGIMLRVDEGTWLKTGVEYFEGRPRLSTVLTLGWSSWMVADLPSDLDELTLRVSRRGEAVEVRYNAGDGPAELAALVFLPPDQEVLAGIVCAAPEGKGFGVAFHDLRIVGREWNGAAAGDPGQWADEPAADQVPEWASSGPGEVPSAWGDERAADLAPASGSGLASDSGLASTAPPRGGAESAERPPWGGDQSGERMPWEDEQPGDAVADWSQPQATDPAADWERLSLSVTGAWSTSLDGDTASTAEQDPPDSSGGLGDLGAGSQGRPESAGNTRSKGSTGSGKLPESLADDLTDPALPATKPAEATAPAPKPATSARRRTKAKLPAPRQPTTAGSSDPADAAEEWISLLTADPVEE
ncbi:MAG TPA: DUF1349 domain-containing protein [Streptosporangiaceae bacterium]|nr:DUF1349 domain-containing protein [Streptosporangiaceae bacterium]